MSHAVTLQGYKSSNRERERTQPSWEVGEDVEEELTILKERKAVGDG